MSARLAAWKVVCGGLFPAGAMARDDLRVLLRDVSWPEVLGLADDHLVTPALRLGLSSRGLDAELPEDARRYLEALHAMNTERNTALMAQLDETIAELNAGGIEPMLLKGTAYLKLATHGDLGARVLADLDLLVRPERVGDAERILRRLGYRGARAALRGHHHLVPLVRAGSVAAVELHRDVLADRARHALPTETVWERLVEREPGRFSVPCAGHLVLHRFLHDQIVDRYASRYLISLRSLQDLTALDALYGASIDYRALHAATKPSGYGGAFKSYLYAAAHIAGVQPDGSPSFGPRQAVNHALCMAVVRWRWPGRCLAVADRFSAVRIRQAYGEDQTLWSLAVNRARTAGGMLARSLRSARRQ